MLMIYENDGVVTGFTRVTANAGRVKVVYQQNEGLVKIVNIETGEELKQFPFVFTLDGFAAVVEEFTRICNSK